MPNSLPPRQNCECGDRRPPVWNESLLASVCRACGGYRRPDRRQ